MSTPIQLIRSGKMENAEVEQERRYNQQAILEDIRNNLIDLRKDVGDLRVDVAERTGKLETSRDIHALAIAEMKKVIDRHSYWIAFGAGMIVTLAWIMTNYILRFPKQ